MRYGFQPINLLLLVLYSAIVLGITGGCSREHYKEEADKEVYRIIDSKWQNDFGQKANYRISDAPPSPNDIKVEQASPKSRVLTLAQVVALATAQNRDYQTQKESLYLTALDLTLTRHQYARQWFGTIDGTYTDDKSGEDDVDLQISGGVDQKLLLLNGIIVNAGIAIDWVRFLTGDPRHTIGSVLSGDLTVPLLGAGAGKSEREALTQAERNVLYRIRTFNRYRKTFVVDIIRDYYNVLQQRESLEITRASYQRQVQSTNQLRMEVEVGQRSQSDADEAEQRLLSAENNLVSAQQRYEQTLDSFKIKLSLPTDADIVLDQNELRALESIGVSQPGFTAVEAIDMALARRLDLANTKDEIDDAQRKLLLAAEGLGVELNLIGSIDVDSNPKTDFSRLQFQKGTYELGIETDLMLDRKAERNAYRESLITLQQSQRGYDEEAERVKLAVRQAYRDLAETAESHRIQKIGLKLAERRVEQQRLLLEYGRGTVRLLLESEDALVQAQNAVTRALVDHTIAKMSFFRDVGILGVRPDGMWEQRAK
jgi:outer membrane protein TolC